MKLTAARIAALAALATAFSIAAAGNAGEPFSPGRDPGPAEYIPIAAENESDPLDDDLDGILIIEESGNAPDRPHGGWFPGSRLYATMLADPRKIGFSGVIRYHDDAFNRYRKRYNGLRSDVLGSDGLFGAVSLGSPLPLYRWVTAGAGSWQVGIEGSVWALFALKDRKKSYFSDGSTMLNADYEIGVPLEFSFRDFSMRYRFYHISTHIGDELMVLYPEIVRKNVSFEALDLYASYEFVRRIRLFAGGGYIVHSFQSARMRPGYVEYGLEIAPFGSLAAGKNLALRPYLAAHGKNWDNNHWAYAGTYALGLQILPASPRPGRISIYAEFHHGSSPDGQFFHERTSYWGLGLLWELI